MVLALWGNPDLSGTLARMNAPAYSQFKPWVQYMNGLLPLIGKNPEATLALEGGGTWKAGTVGEGLTVLYFWAAAPASAGVDANAAAADLARQDALVARFGSSNVSVVGVNLDTKSNAAAVKELMVKQKAQAAEFFAADHPDTSLAPEPFPITSVPTVVMIGPKGNVFFVGDPRNGDPAAVLSFVRRM